MSCNCSAPMVGGSRKRYQIGKRRNSSSRRSKRGGGWFSSWFGSSDENKEESGNSLTSMFNTQSQQNSSAPVQVPLQSQFQAGGSRKRGIKGRRGGRHCKTSEYKLGGRSHRRSSRTRKSRK